MDYYGAIDRSRLPAHVGVIMDGNGRWARQRRLIRTEGHNEGLKAAKRIVKAAAEIGIGFLTLYTFSTENWKRTADEVGFLMGLIKRHLIAELDFYRENNVRLRFSGDINGLPADVVKELRQAVKDTAFHNGLTVVLAINYGGRDELVRAFSRICQKDLNPKNINEKMISENLDNPDIPDPDLIIRSADERRISNFLIWEAAYSEYIFSEKLWPDWTDKDFFAAISEFQKRDRRFGGATI